MASSQQTSNKMNAADIINKYHNDINIINKEKNKILNALHQKYKEQKLLTQPDTQSFKSKSSLTQLQEKPRKLVKLNSQISSQNLPQASKQGKSSQLKKDKNETTKDEKKTEVPKAIADRNKRIFGGLTSHLKKAGEHLKSQQFKEKQRNAKEILNKLIAKENQQRQKVQIKKREELETQIKKLEQEKKMVEDQLLKNENMMLGQIVQVHLNTLGQFYMTKSQPKVCWKPSKPLKQNQKQEKIKQTTQKYLKVQFVNKKKKLEQQCLSKISNYRQIVDHSNYMQQNQRQFYGNLISRMYGEYNGFLMTRYIFVLQNKSAEPRIFWKPKVVSENMLKRKDETDELLKQKRQALKKANDEFYQVRKPNIEQQLLCGQILNQDNNQDDDDDLDYTFKNVNQQKQQK